MFHQMKQSLAPPTHYFLINFHTTFIQSPNPIDLGEDRDEYAWKTASYMPWLIKDDSDVGFMFRNMVENNILYMYVRSICNCDECKYGFNLMICNELFNYGHFVTF